MMKPLGAFHNYVNMAKNSAYCGLSIAVTDVFFRCVAE